MHEVVDGVTSHASKDGVLLVQPIAGAESDEELGAVGVGLIAVGCGHNAPVQCQSEKLNASTCSLPFCIGHNSTVCTR